MMDIPLRVQSAFRCPHCFGQTADKSVCCEFCGGEIKNGEPKTLFGKIKRMLGVDLSSDIVTIDLEDDGHFFTSKEIEFLLEMKNLIVLGLDEVPDFEVMFCQSRRVRKPIDRGEIQ